MTGPAHRVVHELHRSDAGNSHPVANPSKRCLVFQRCPGCRAGYGSEGRHRLQRCAPRLADRDQLQRLSQRIRPPTVPVRSTPLMIDPGPDQRDQS